MLPFPSLNDFTSDPFREIPDKYDIYQVISGFCTDGMIFRSKHRKFFIWAASTYISEKDISTSVFIICKGLLSSFADKFISSLVS